MKFKTTLTPVAALFAVALFLFPFTANVRASGFATFSPPQNMGTYFNTTSMDQLPAISPSGLSMYFGSARTGTLGGQDIWVSQRASLNSPWGPAVNLGATLNTSSNDTPSTISPNGLELYMQSNRTPSSGLVDIYISTRTDPNNDFGWSAPVSIGTVINTTANDYFGSLFVDPATGAATLFFNSDRAGGLGLNDIYQSTRNANGTFNPPTSVTVVNSAFNEERTAISRDGLELFFSSNRLVPTTNQAVFVSTRASTSAEWGAPVPVASLNKSSSNAQPGLSPDGSIVYFVSNRPGGSGLGDIYSANRCSLFVSAPCTNRLPTADFDGDGRSDVSVFRPSTGAWYVMRSGSNTFIGTQFGTSGDKIVPGDYDGDSRFDLAVFRPGDGTWYIQRSSDLVVSITRWGIATDRPVPGDYDGDGSTDIAVFRDGVWYIIQSSTGLFRHDYFGLPDDIPIASGSN